MTVSHYIAFIVGFALAVIICVGVAIAWHKKILRIFVNKNGFENGLMLGAFVLVILSLVYDLGVITGDGQITSAVISLIGSVLFSYLLTKRYSKITYEDELKKVASTAYRHNKNLFTKIKYEIDIIDLIFSKNTCGNNINGNCEYTHTLYRIRDSLIGFKRDAEENINDWSDIIPEEINAINMVVEIQRKLNKLLYDRADTEDSIDRNKLEVEREQLQKDLEKYQNVLDDNPALKIILENEKKLSAEMDDLIKRELAAKTTKDIKAVRNYDEIKVYYDTILKTAAKKAAKKGSKK